MSSRALIKVYLGKICNFNLSESVFPQYYCSLSHVILFFFFLFIINKPHNRRLQTTQTNFIWKNKSTIIIIIMSKIQKLNSCIKTRVVNTLLLPLMKFRIRIKSIASLCKFTGKSSVVFFHLTHTHTLTRYKEKYNYFRRTNFFPIFLST